jgi:hypothetical protein
MGLRFSKNGIATFRAVNTPDYDADAQLFITATGISGTNANATNQLVLDLKAANIWIKMKAIYPMIGSTATSQKFNLKNPADTDAAFRLSFVGGGTHSANGYLPNGVNAYANTFLNSSTNLSLNSGHFSYYSRTNNTTSAIDMGSLKSTPDSYSDLVLYYTGFTYFRFNNAGFYQNIGSTNTLGFYCGSRTASTIIKLFKNSSVIINGVAGSNSTSTVNFYIGAVNNTGIAQYFSNRECAFASIGDGLSDAEALAFYTAVQAFQTTLGRQV